MSGNRVVGLKVYDAGLGEWVDAISNPQLQDINDIVDTHTTEIAGHETRLDNIDTNGVAKLSTARNINLGGDLSGGTNFNGTSDITITASILAAVKQAIIDEATPVGSYQAFDRTTAPTGWIAANGDVVLRSSVPRFDAQCYCGDANNATASHSYRTTSLVSPSSNRSTTGQYIVIPDMRGEYIRGWDNGKGTDSGRTLWSYQTDQIKSHDHVLNGSAGTNDVAGGSSYVPKLTPSLNSWVWGTATDMEGASGVGLTGGSENRVRNGVGLICIKI